MNKIFFILIITKLNSEDIISSTINNITLTLEKQKNCEAFIEKIKTKYNTSISNISFFLYKIKLTSTIKNFLSNILIQNATFSIKQDQLKSENITTFQIVGFGISAKIQNFELEAKKINAYIDLEDNQNIDITFESNYKLKYNNFELVSNKNLYLKDMSLNGSNLLGTNKEYNLKIQLEKLEINLNSKSAILCNTKIFYPKIKIEAIIDKIHANENNMNLKEILIKINNKKIKIEEGIVYLKNNQEIEIKNIKCHEKQFQIQAPNGIIKLNKEQIVLNNVIVYFKNSKITIKKVIIKNPANFESELLDITIESSAESISKIKKGYWNIVNKTFKLSEGSI